MTHKINISLHNVKKYSNAAKNGDIVGMWIDMINKRLIFFRNGQCLGVAVENLPDEVYPSVSLGRADEKILLIENPIMPVCDL